MKLNINDFRNKLYESIGLSEASFKNSDFTVGVGHYYADDVKNALLLERKCIWVRKVELMILSR